MKRNFYLQQVKHLRIAALVSLSLTFVAIAYGQLTNNDVYKITPGEILASIKANNLDSFDRTRGEFSSEQKLLGKEVLRLFEDSKMSNLSRCAAAYYLGELHFSEATSVLATDIKLQPVLLTTDHLTPLHGLVVVDALVKIGIPSIPSMIRNLEESDDSTVRTLSLRVIYRIEGDKEVVKFRLRKALNAEKDHKAQTRLQAALKSLAKIK